MKTYIVTTSNGPDYNAGTRQVGVFKGTPTQIMEYLIQNNLEQPYGYTMKEITVVDTSDLRLRYVDSVNIDRYGSVTVKLDIEKQQELRREKLISNALNKLTQQEKEALGIQHKFK